MKLEITGLKEIQTKFSRLGSNLPKEFHEATKEIGDIGVKKFKSNIQKARSKTGKMRDLTPQYKIQKKKKFGKVYPILVATGKLQRDIKYEVNNSTQVEMGVMTNRSEEILGYQASRGRNPIFLDKKTRLKMLKAYQKATKDAIKNGGFK